MLNNATPTSNYLHNDVEVTQTMTAIERFLATLKSFSCLARHWQEHLAASL